MDKPPVRNLQKNPLCTRILDTHIPTSLEKHPKLKEYNNKGDPNKHVQLIGEILIYFHANESAKCELISLTLIRSSRL